MLIALYDRLRKAREILGSALTSPMCLAVIPAVCLGIYWMWGERGLVLATFSLPALYVLTGARRGSDGGNGFHNTLIGLVDSDAFCDVAREYFRTARESGLKSAIFKVEIDDHPEFLTQHGHTGADTLMNSIGTRLLTVLRDRDAVSRTSEFGFTICLSPGQTLDLEACIQLSGRLQAVVEEPVSLDGASVYATACVGFCQHTRMMTRDSDAWIVAAEQALNEARQHGPNAIRAYSDEMRQRQTTHSELMDEVCRALERGQIQPWFQPQISTDTGLVTGFEALARWNHPNRGMVPPLAFLPAMEQAGMLERLAEVMLYHSFTALKAWDNAGARVPQVGVNFAGPELSNPMLVEKIKWELDRFNLAPERLAVEVLETVVAGSPDDTIARNLKGLGRLGCRIDLDDFGTGQASIASIRRFSVSRIKIDRSFVIKADRDPEQQRMISAILTMAERLEIETLAEGVETVGEHALLAQLGCNHVQGFGIAKPMPFDQTLDWIASHNAKLQAAPRIIGNKSGN